MKLRIPLFSLLAVGAIAFSGCGEKAPPPEPDYSILETNSVPAAGTESTNQVSTNAATTAAQGSMVRLDARPGSQMRIEGTSTMHDWQVVGKLIGGYVEIPASLLGNGSDLKPGKVNLKADLFVPVRSLKSVTKEGNAYSTKMDDIMYEKLLADQHQRIMFRSNEAELTSAPSGANEPIKLKAKGELIVAGVTNAVTMPVEIVRTGENTFKVSGAAGVKMTDFKIEPPAPVGMLIKTGDDVKMLFTWVVAQKAQ